MHRRANFASYFGPGWPSIEWMEPYFLTRAGQLSFPRSGCDSACLFGEGLYGTAGLASRKEGRVDVDLATYFNADLGVLLHYQKRGGGFDEVYESKGDVRRLHEWVESTHGTKLPVGLFIPFEMAWEAVKEFITSDGELPKCVEWIRDVDQPPGTWPEA
jgi:hypothetical protein